MAACTRCGFQQNGVQAYCEQCGMFLPTLAVYNPVQPEYRIPSQVVVQRPNQGFLLGNGLTTQMILDRSIREAIAIVGLLIAGFGTFGFFNDLIGSDWALLLGFLVLIGGIIAVSVLFFVQKLLPRFRWPQIVGGGIGTTIIGFVLMMVVAGLAHNTLGKDFGYGSTIFFYGLGIVALVIW